jgi:hypothetical protein
MTLADERLRELDNPSLTPDERALLRSEVAADLIHKGQYEAASIKGSMRPRAMLWASCGAE